MKNFLSIVLFLIISNLLLSQTYFNKLYDYNGNNSLSNAASTAIELNNGDYFVSGVKFLPSFGALHFFRININGDTVLEKRFPKTNCSYSTGIGNSLIRCYDGNLVQAGTYIDSSSIYWDALLVKLTENGDTLWTKTYGGANYDLANIVCQTPDSGFVLMGGTQSFGMGTTGDFYLIKTDKNGNLIWQHTYGTLAIENCVSGQITLDGGFIVSGYRGGNLYIVKTDSGGIFQWDQVYSGTSQSAFIKQLPDSTYILVGAKNVGGLAGQAYMAKLTKAGVIIWQQTYGGAGDQQFYAMPIILNDGSIVCSGVSTLTTTPWGLLIKTDSSGNQQWLRTYYSNPNIDNYIYDVKHTSDNGFILTGSGFGTSQDAWVVKVDSNGCEVAGCNVGVEEEKTELNNISVYPNPSNGVFTISATGTKIKEVRVMDVFGRIIIEINALSTNTFNLDISQYSQGIYYIRITNENGEIMVKKLIKE